MNRDEPQGNSAQNSREYLGESGEGAGWTTTKVAAQMLGVSRRTVQAYVRRGELEARQEGEGPTKTFYVSIDSLNALRKRRRRKGRRTESFATVSADADVAMKIGESIKEAIGLTGDRLEARASEAADLQVRLELAGRSEASLREELEREREERRKAQEEARRLREELEAEWSKGFFRRLFGG